MSSKQYAHAHSADGRITAHVAQTGRDRWGGDIAVDSRIVKMLDGRMLDQSIEQIAEGLIEFEQNPPPGIPTRTPSGPALDLDTAAQTAWVRLAADARREQFVSLRVLRTAINDRCPDLDHAVGISELSSWERGALPLPEAAIVRAWALALGVASP